MYACILQRVDTGTARCELSSQTSSTYKCSVPPGLGVKPLSVTWQAPQGKSEYIQRMYTAVIHYVSYKCRVPPGLGVKTVYDLEYPCR